MSARPHVVGGVILATQTPLQMVVSHMIYDGWHQFSWGTGAHCMCVVPYHMLANAFIHLEERIEHLHQFRWNHHGRQLARWLGRWQQRIDRELSRRPARKLLWRE